MQYVLTDAGKNLLLRALQGDTITFTKLQIGNGSQAPETAAALANPLMDLGIDSIAIADGYCTIASKFSNDSIESGFRATELGIFAQDPDNSSESILYTYGYDSNNEADYIPAYNNKILETQIQVMVFVSASENVSAQINESLVYAGKSDLDAHTGNQNNPHGVTKDQVGLGNVLNQAPNDMAPTFTDVSTLTTTSSGETISSVFAKIKLAISTLLSHIGSKSNPHAVTAAQAGAAAAIHQHSAVDIISGTLGVARGGTGQTSFSTSSAGIAYRGISFATEAPTSMTPGTIVLVYDNS